MAHKITAGWKWPTFITLLVSLSHLSLQVEVILIFIIPIIIHVIVVCAGRGGP